jgi:hypothetical protein
LGKIRAKARAKGENEKVWIWAPATTLASVFRHLEGMSTSSWEADQGRLVLKGATLKGANLQGANLGVANLEGAELGRANLGEAKLVWANLEGAKLVDANLKGVELKGANLQGARYEPNPGALPDIVQLRSARRLETLWFDVKGSPHGLEELKQAFKNAGMRQQEREITYAIKRSEQKNAWEEGDYLESL